MPVVRRPLCIGVSFFFWFSLTDCTEVHFDRTCTCLELDELLDGLSNGAQAAFLLLAIRALQDVLLSHGRENVDEHHACVDLQLGVVGDPLLVVAAEDRCRQAGAAFHLTNPGLHLLHCSKLVMDRLDGDLADIHDALLKRKLQIITIWVHELVQEAVGVKPTALLCLRQGLVDAEVGVVVEHDGDLLGDKAVAPIFWMPLCFWIMDFGLDDKAVEQVLVDGIFRVTHSRQDSLHVDPDSAKLPLEVLPPRGIALLGRGILLLLQHLDGPLLDLGYLESLSLPVGTTAVPDVVESSIPTT